MRRLQFANLQAPFWVGPSILLLLTLGLWFTDRDVFRKLDLEREPLHMQQGASGEKLRCS
ncbi:MAG TPA: hypothetical protein VN673_01950 [Clostridia bacterium]|nr:hypothetical protein [Clostridia bacterium]